MIEAPILAAMVTASATLISKGIEWVGRRDARSADSAKQVVGEAYDQLRLALTDSCTKILRLLEGGDNERIQSIRERLYPNLVLPDVVKSEFDAEFRYRMEYLKNCGVVTLVGGSEYGITAVGRAFIEEARRRKDYYRVLFSS